MLRVLVLIFILSFSAKAQTIMGKSEQGPLVKLTLKQAKGLIKEFNGELDVAFKTNCLNDVYVLNDGRAVLLFDTHGFLYNSIKSVEEWIIYLKSKQAKGGPSHILKGKLLYG